MLQRDFTEEQHMLRDTFRKFLASEIVPHMEEWREAGIVIAAAKITPDKKFPRFMRAVLKS
jgi:acyl-CoA dehydrogenase